MSTTSSACLFFNVSEEEGEKENAHLDLSSSALNSYFSYSY